MSDTVTICFITTTEHKSLLEQWAKQDDRTVSATLRQIVEKEAQRRQAKPENQKPVTVH